MDNERQPVEVWVLGTLPDGRDVHPQFNVNVKNRGKLDAGREWVLATVLTKAGTHTNMMREVLRILQWGGLDVWNDWRSEFVVMDRRMERVEVADGGEELQVGIRCLFPGCLRRMSLADALFAGGWHPLHCSFECRNSCTVDPPRISPGNAAFGRARFPPFVP